MSGKYFFGYGSLVNRLTHAHAPLILTRVTGWRRAWRHTKLRDMAFLTVIPDADAEVAGVIAPVPDADWAALDAREFAYARHTISVTEAPQGAEVAIYAIPEENHFDPTVNSPILLSYLDVVIQGYFREFGAAGVEEFITTTSGWDAPILNDRDAPLYPRHQVLTVQERALVDDLLAKLGTVIARR